ncbi:MAG: baseplate J/gp47 family protein [Novosphingobium sp.]|nr:baseplate J/gp47 family protein [Novosphingobium sp.]MBK6801654.1 baseplate J/gp47 family protein [Novosphingobium sp.]MBK9009977.1 baseplate J/gp47 family protein [Novosphingobium sp.]
MPIASDSFTGVDLSRLPAPQVIEPLDFETILAQSLAQFQVYFPAFDATLESEPVMKLIQLFAYRELVLRQRLNDAARAVMPAFATGPDLDALAALFGVERFILTPADPEVGIAEVLESDTDFRRRMVLAPEGFSVAGPVGAYIFHALSADSAVLDASAVSPDPGEVVVTVLGRDGDGTPAPEVLAAVEARLSADDVRPLTDLVTVQAATIVPFTVEAELTLLPGPDSSVVLTAAQARLDAHLAAIRRLGRDVTRAAIIAALCPEGVQNVVLTSPATDIVLSSAEAGHCTAIDIVNAGLGE